MLEMRQERKINRRRVIWATRLGFSSLPLFFLAGLGVVPAVAALVLAPRALEDIRGGPSAFTDSGMVQAASDCAVVTLILAGIALATIFVVILL